MLKRESRRAGEDRKRQRGREVTFLSNDLYSSSSPLHPHPHFCFPARKKKRYRRPRKSKWSTGVIKKPKKKKKEEEEPPVPSSSSSSFTSLSSMSSKFSSESSAEEVRAAGRRAVNGSAGAGSSSPSESSDGGLSGFHRTPNRITRSHNGVLTNGYHRHTEPVHRQLADGVPVGVRRTRSSKTLPGPETVLNGQTADSLGLCA